MPVVIIGGGITGLSAAWELAKARREVTLIEPGACGGLLRTERVVVDGQDCIVECGADSWIRTKPWLRDLAGELGLREDVIACSDAFKGTFIFRDGALVALPRGLRMTAPAEWRPVLASPLIGWPTKLRMLRETLRRPVQNADRSVSDFVRDHFGDEALEYLAEPLFAGVYGGSPEALGVESVLPKLVEYERRFGSVIRGARRDPPPAGALFESMRFGLGQIPDALISQLQGRVRFVGASAECIEPGRVRAGGEWIEASEVILACGAPAASALLAASEGGSLLASVRHSSATIFAFGFRRDALDTAPAGFGFLVPRKQRKIILAATWVTNKFAHRAPDGVVIARCFVAGDHDEGLIPAVRADLARITRIDAEPIFTRVYRWPDSMPQYGVGHAALIAQIQLQLPRNVQLAGGFLNGVGMPDCSRSGVQAAARLTSY